VQGLVKEAGDGDQILVMSNGGFGGLHEKLLAALQAR
jgi:UDP-N-acetylmuramate: L-alanyl-gamma-D-glutamyl-meso-diaminopimelate ligase